MAACAAARVAACAAACVRARVFDGVVVGAGEERVGAGREAPQRAMAAYGQRMRAHSAATAATAAAATAATAAAVALAL